MAELTDADRREIYGELGRRLCAAYTSNQLGITIAYALKTHVGPVEELGSYWIELAERVTKEVNESIMFRAKEAAE